VLKHSVPNPAKPTAVANAAAQKVISTMMLTPAASFNVRCLRASARFSDYRCGPLRSSQRVSSVTLNSPVEGRSP
jgi:hypothetical protein